MGSFCSLPAVVHYWYVLNIYILYKISLYKLNVCIIYRNAGIKQNNLQWGIKKGLSKAS